MYKFMEMQSKTIKIGWSVGILGLVFLALSSCSTAQKDNKQTEAATEVLQPQEESLILEPEAITQPSNAEEIKLNPPHGEPGHRCEIPVGSPLNGSAAVQAPAPSAAPAPVVAPPPPTANSPASLAPTVENARRLNAAQGTQNAAPSTGEKPKTNPAHGQPWHRCDIAVGAPLP